MYAKRLELGKSTDLYRLQMAGKRPRGADNRGPAPFSNYRTHVAAAWQAMTANTVGPDVRFAALWAPIIGFLSYLGFGRQHRQRHP